MDHRLHDLGDRPLQEQEEMARRQIRRLRRKQRLNATEERELRNCLALVRRHEKYSAEEIRLRARRGWIA